MNSDSLKKILLDYIQTEGLDRFMNILEEINNMSDLEEASNDYPSIEDSESINQENRHTESTLTDPVVHSMTHTDPSQKIGTYVKQKILGVGGMGEVWQVKDPDLHRTVALKIMHDRFESNASVHSDFDEEAQINAQLQHPGIVPVYSFEHLDSGIRYLTMKEIEGKTLKEVIQSVHHESTSIDGWTIRRLVDVFHSVCETMAFAHNKGVIHRDLKPANIMLGDYGEVQIVDWGIAKVLPNQKKKGVQTRRSLNNIHEEEGSILGTPTYMSPEQSRGEISLINNRSDIYSLGIILYEILTGETLHKGDPYDIIRQKQQGVLFLHHAAPQPDSLKTVSWTEENTQAMPSDIGASPDKQTKPFKVPSTHKGKPLPKELHAICVRAMQCDPEKRYQNAKQLANDIQDWLDGAQRKEKALALLKHTEGMEKTRVQLLQEARQFWMQANACISNEGLDSEKGWALWNKSNISQENADEVQQEIHHLLLAALVNDPELVETHQRLVDFEYQEYVQALLDADKKSRSRSERRMLFYMEYLSESELQYWKERKEKDIASLELLRKRQGRLVGRAHEVAQLKQKVQEHRLISVIGTAGVGKTHLVLEVLNQWHNEKQQEAIFCDLSTAHDELGVLQNIAKTLSINLSSIDPLQQIERELKKKNNMLMVLDNAEQVIKPVGLVISQILRTIPNLKIITTSLLKLGIIDEYIVRIRPMSVLEGVELFINRAQRADQDFTLTDQNRTTVGNIVQKLDCLPLAIELAAARVSTLPVSEIKNRLSERFSLLQGKLRDTEKQQALIGALNWSWDLLSPIEQTAFAQCSVFKGGFTLEAAESVIDVSSFPKAPYIIDLLEALCDDNLLNKDRQADGTFRYSMLASMLEYTTSKLEEIQAQQKNCTDPYIRHAEFYGHLFRKERINISSNLLTKELDNFMSGVQHGTNKDAFDCCQAAIEHFKAKGPIRRGIALTTTFLSRKNVEEKYFAPIHIAKIRCLRIAGQVKQAREEAQKMIITSFKRSADTHDISSEQDKQQLRCAADLLMERGNIEESESFFDEAQLLYSQARNIYQQINETEGVIESLIQNSTAVRKQSQYESARDLCLQALELCDLIDAPLQKVDALTELGVTLRKLGKYTQTLDVLRQAQEIIGEDDETLRGERICSSLGFVYFRLGQTQQSIEQYEKGIAICVQIGNRRNEGTGYGNLGLVYKFFGDYQKCLELYQRSLEISREVGNKISEGLNLGNMGNVYSQIGNYEKSILYKEQAIEIAKQIGDKRSEGIQLGNLSSLYFYQEELEKALEYANKALIIAKEIKNKRSEGIQLGNIGDILFEQHRPKEAESYLKQAVEICSSIGFSVGVGVYSASLALLYAQNQRLDEAIVLIEESEPKVKHYALEYGKLLCKKSIILHRAKHHAQAKECIKQVREIIQTDKLGTNSPLKNVIKKSLDAMSKDTAQV